jgi:hypothetical protein
MHHPSQLSGLTPVILSTLDWIHFELDEKRFPLTAKAWDDITHEHDEIEMTLIGESLLHIYKFT